MAESDELRSAVAAGQSAWPQLELPAEVFTRFLHEHGPPSDEQRAADLYLACACLEDVPGAAEAFARVHGPDLRRVFGRAGPRRIAADDAIQQLLTRLLVDTPARPAGLRSYAGRGPLAGWVHVAAARFRVDLDRQRPDPGSPSPASTAALLQDAAAADPELAFLKDKYRGEFRLAFAEAIASLDARQRNLLRMNLVEGLSATRIAAAYGVHRATTKRWLASAREDLLAGTRAAMSRRLGVDTTELDSIMRLIESRFEVSVRRAFDAADA